MKFEDLKEGDEVTVTFTTKVARGYNANCFCTFAKDEPTTLDLNYLENMMKNIPKHKVTVKQVKKEKVEL